MFEYGKGWNDIHAKSGRILNVKVNNLTFSWCRRKFTHLTHRFAATSTQGPNQGGYGVARGRTSTVELPWFLRWIGPCKVPRLQRRIRMQRLWSCGERRRGEGTPEPQCPDFMRLNDINSTEPRIGFSRVGKNPMGGSRRWPTEWSIQKSTERRSLSTKWCAISHSKSSHRKPWSLYLVSTDMKPGKPHLSGPCLRAFPSFARTGEVRPRDAGSAVLSPESGAAQWRLPSGAVRLLKWDLQIGER